MLEILLKYLLTLSLMDSEDLPSFFPSILAMAVDLSSLLRFMNSMMVQSSFTVKKFLVFPELFLAEDLGRLLEADFTALDFEALLFGLLAGAWARFEVPLVDLLRGLFTTFLAVGFLDLEADF